MVDQRLCKTPGCNNPARENPYRGPKPSYCSKECYRQWKNAWDRVARKDERNRTSRIYKVQHREATRAYQRKQNALRWAKAKAYDQLHEAIVPWWNEVKEALQDRTVIPAPPEYIEVANGTD